LLKIDASRFADKTVCVCFKFLAFYKNADYDGGQHILKLMVFYRDPEIALFFIDILFHLFYSELITDLTQPDADSGVQSVRLSFLRKQE
jgi:hypothetical protein